ncbi:MAG: acylphosphatase [Steroidobacteraceae bacterium]
MSQSSTGARFLVSGRVQGVFFRASTRTQALRLGLTGYAKNLPDGRVEVVAIGEAAAVEALAQWLWQGSPGSNVTDVQRVAGDLTPQPATGFITL